jgi:ribA/ribD-fused uncharacterized protein
MQDQLAFAVREWPGTGTGVKTDAYSTKILERHERQYDAVASYSDLEPFTKAEGGIIVAEIFPGQRIVLFQGSCLSNFQPAIFCDANGVSYNCTEQAFQAIKALFVAKQASAKCCSAASEAALDVYRKVMKSTNPLYQKLSASAKFLPMDQDTLDLWSRASAEVMLEINRLKFVQNKHLCDRLLALQASRICEANPDDSVWGIGMGARAALLGADPDPAAAAPAVTTAWRGLACMSREEIDAATFAGRNRLGRILQHVRDELVAGRERPLEDSDDGVRTLVAELFRGTEAAADEGGEEKEAFRQRVVGFASRGTAPLTPTSCGTPTSCCTPTSCGRWARCRWSPPKRGLQDIA